MFTNSPKSVARTTVVMDLDSLWELWKHPNPLPHACGHMPQSCQSQSHSSYGSTCRLLACPTPLNLQSWRQCHKLADHMGGRRGLRLQPYFPDYREVVQLSCISKSSVSSFHLLYTNYVFQEEYKLIRAEVRM